MAQRRIRPVAGVGALIIAVAAGTWLVLSLPDPEAVRVVSDDGRVVVFGAASPSVGTLSVVRSDDVAVAAPSQAADEYRVAFDGEVAIPSGFALRVSYRDEDLLGTAPNRLSVFAYDRSSSAWVAVPSVVDPAARTVTTDTTGIDAIVWTLGAR